MSGFSPFPSSYNDSDLGGLPQDYLWFGFHCVLFSSASLMYLTFCIIELVLILPLCLLILHQWFRQSRWGNSGASTASVTSHSDSFTYHMVLMELCGIFGWFLASCGIFTRTFNVALAGFCSSAIPWYGELFIHLLTCVERYLAVVHPVTYRSLRGERGIRIRSICISCVWLVCLGGVLLTFMENTSRFLDLCLLIFSLITIFFCSLAVLSVLIRPKPGEQGTDRVDQSKKRAFYTILAILGTLLLKCLSSLVVSVGRITPQHGECVMLFSEMWLNLPSILVLPLLFLYRTRPLACCRNNH